MDLEKEAFSKTNIKGDPKNVQNFGGKTSMHKSTLMLDFLKEIAAPLVGVLLLLVAYCCLLY